MENVVEITAGIYQVRIPIPFPLKTVQCYLVREDEGWTMIDTGLNHPLAMEAWAHAFQSLHTAPRAVRRILLTHSHPDHYGLAGHWQNVSSAPVFALDKEIEIIPHEWPDEQESIPTLTHFFAQHGAPPAALERVSVRSREVLRMVNPQPVLLPLRAGDELTLGGERYRIHWVPGHADGHSIFHRASDGLLFVGDHVLMKITPNIALWPRLAPNPLRDYLASLERVARLETRLALPGHRALIHDLPGRVAEIKQHHAARLRECRKAAGDGCTAFQVCRVLFPHLQTADDIRLGMVETLSHLEYLVGEGRLERLDGKTIRYRQMLK